MKDVNKSNLGAEMANVCDNGTSVEMDQPQLSTHTYIAVHYVWLGMVGCLNGVLFRYVGSAKELSS